MSRRSNRLTNKKPPRVEDIIYFQKVCSTWKQKCDAAKSEIKLLNLQISRCQQEINDLAHDSCDMISRLRKIDDIIQDARAAKHNGEEVDPYDILFQIVKVTDGYF